MTEEEKKHYEDVIYPEIARKDFERELYKQIDDYYCCNGYMCGCQGITVREELKYQKEKPFMPGEENKNGSREGTNERMGNK